MTNTNPIGVESTPEPVEDKRDEMPTADRRFQEVAFQRASEADSRTFTFPFSSEYPVKRYYGNEVLSHERDAADLSRLNDGAPLLFNHDPGKVIGFLDLAGIPELELACRVVERGPEGRAGDLVAVFQFAQRPCADDGHTGAELCALDVVDRIDPRGAGGAGAIGAAVLGDEDGEHVFGTCLKLAVSGRGRGGLDVEA